MHGEANILASPSNNINLFYFFSPSGNSLSAVMWPVSSVANANRLPRTSGVANAMQIKPNNNAVKRGVQHPLLDNKPDCFLFFIFPFLFFDAADFSADER